MYWAQFTEQYLNALAPLKDRIFCDLHVGADPNSVAEQSEMRFVILKKNGGDHGLLRGLGHAAYNSIFIKHDSFGIAYGYANAIDAWLVCFAIVTDMK